MKVNCIIGIDPGANGGIAVYLPGTSAKVVKMPKNDLDLRDFFGYYSEWYSPIVFLEKLSVRPDDIVMQGEKAGMGKIYRIQKMMANYEHLKAIIETSGIPFVMVHPMTWQTKLCLRAETKGYEKSARKQYYRNVAAQLYPEVNVTLWNADALLIMHFGRYACANMQNWVREQLPKQEYQKLM